ncbi:MAG TPA: tetratricopeptide repeat protein [Candidatus Saccharimonadales bacterium]|nr:tetratricopeptide repeat protein [Candidatus Saccharimonadales bacterium]
MRARKSLTRHEMKQDELVSWATRVFVWIEENSTTVLAGLGALLVLVIGGVGATAWMHSRSDNAYRLLAQVQKAVRTPVATESDPNTHGEVFATSSERSNHIIESADQLLDAYSSGEAANWARYYKAVALLDLGKADDAGNTAKEIIDRADADSMLAALAQMVAAQAAEAKKDLTQAIDHYTAAAESGAAGFPPELGLLNEARCLDELGRTQEAVAAYQKILDDYPNSPLAARAGKKLQELRGTPQGS